MNCLPLPQELYLKEPLRCDGERDRKLVELLHYRMTRNQQSREACGAFKRAYIFSDVGMVLKMCKAEGPDLDGLCGKPWKLNHSDADLIREIVSQETLYRRRGEDEDLSRYIAWAWIGGRLFAVQRMVASYADMGVSYLSSPFSDDEFRDVNGDHNSGIDEDGEWKVIDWGYDAATTHKLNWMMGDTNGLMAWEY